MLQVAHNRFTALSLLFALTLAIAPAQAAEHCSGEHRLDEVIASDHRSSDNQMRDVFRHPKETLQWFGLEPTMTVVEIWPGGGWYSEILAPYLKDCGAYYAAGFNPESDLPFYRINAEKLRQKFAGSPNHFGAVITTVLHPPRRLEIAPPGSADRVLTFRNVHNWMKAGYAQEVFQAMHRALKPGGLLGVVEHRAASNTQQDPRALSGYVTESYVIQLATQAGFQYLGSSEINANPKDDRDHPKGVWTLPPSLRLGEQDKQKYLDIGESDRMTLKFRKSTNIP